jgi:hypothetical protein
MEPVEKTAPPTGMLEEDQTRAHLGGEPTVRAGEGHLFVSLFVRATLETSPVGPPRDVVQVGGTVDVIPLKNGPRGEFCGRVTRAPVGRMFITAKSNLEIIDVGTWACQCKHETDPLRYTRVMLREFGMDEDRSVALYRECGVTCGSRLVFHQTCKARAEARLGER